MEAMTGTEMDLPTPGDFGLVLGVAHASELRRFRPHPDEARLARAMSAARRRDFLLGRLAARRALGAQDGPVLIERSRPLFPPPFAGSVSHAGGVGVALVDQVGRRVGVDLELRRISPRAARGVCTDAELAWAEGSAERATQLFCAKEAAYKVLPSGAQERLRWCDVAIEPRDRGGFAAFVRGFAIDGWWRTGPAVLAWALSCG
jgi:enterobactin synthetase component D